ncbi:MAG: hypothetical protein JW738_00055 [Actinobacteria bacterium]|nr:hypothetical protein [Actinomycetota bacterium]
MSDLYFEPYEIWVRDDTDRSNPNPLWRAQTRWMLENLQLLRAGRWPSRPTSYTDPSVRSRSVRAKATFETPLQWACELTRRLEMCGTDGLDTEACFAWGETAERLGKFHNIDEREMTRRIKAVIRYISRPKLKGGYWRKNNDFQPKTAK